MNAAEPITLHRCRRCGGLGIGEDIHDRPCTHEKKNVEQRRYIPAEPELCESCDGKGWVRDYLPSFNERGNQKFVLRECPGCVAPDRSSPGSTQSGDAARGTRQVTEGNKAVPTPSPSHTEEMPPDA